MVKLVKQTKVTIFFRGSKLMNIMNPTREEMGLLLKKSKRIAVVGLSDNPERTSYMVSKAMLDNGYEIIPVNPLIDEVFGVKVIVL